MSEKAVLVSQFSKLFWQRGEFFWKTHFEFVICDPKNKTGKVIRAKNAGEKNSSIYLDRPQNGDSLLR